MKRLEGPTRDSGIVLPIVLVVSVVLSLVVVGLATYASTTLRYGQVVESSADRLATADGAMDNLLEEFDRGVSECVTTQGANAGITYTLQQGINGIQAELTCEVIGGTAINATDRYALVLTGAGAGRNGPLLEITNGGGSPNVKTFTGSVYMAAPPNVGGPNPTISLQSSLNVLSGDIRYTSGVCPSADVDLVDGPAKEVTISPVGFGTRCDSRAWDDAALFGSRKPPEPNVTSFPPRSQSTPTAACPNAGNSCVDNSGPAPCYVWSPGEYDDNPPQLVNNSYNYFRSGDYYFDDVENWVIANAFVLAGWPGITGPSIEDNALDNNGNSTYTALTNPCHGAWSTDADQTGAAFYMGDDSRITLGQNSSLEISGRMHGDYNVGLQALETNGDPSDLEGEDEIVFVTSGAIRQLSIQGHVWAPRAGIAFDVIANKNVAALTGGAVLAELSAGAAANASNFTISVETQPVRTEFLLTATATNAGSTTVQTLIDYRSDDVYAILSRRVVDLTPE